MPKGQAQKPSVRRRNLIISIGLAVIVAGLVGGYMLEKRSAGPAEQAVRLPLKTEKALARTMDGYLCPCGSCSLVLAECSCGTAHRVKRDTRQRLAREETVNEADVAWILENIHQARPAG